LQKYKKKNLFTNFAIKNSTFAEFFTKIKKRETDVLEFVGASSEIMIMIMIMIIIN